MRSLEFDVAAFEDLAWWVERDRTQALRIIRLIREIQKEPFTGLGKPEPLRHDLKGCWSRRIDQEHRLVVPGVLLYAVNRVSAPGESIEISISYRAHAIGARHGCRGAGF